MQFLCFQSFLAASSTFCKKSSYGDIECTSHTKIHVFCYSIHIDRIKMKDFWEEYSNQLEDNKFRRYYRMDKCTFRALTSFLNPETREYQGGPGASYTTQDGSNDIVFSWKQNAFFAIEWTFRYF